jgi:hypothetical protein
VLAGPPLITELQPRGAERGRTFLLTIVGRDIPDGARIWSTMPASFTPVTASQGQNQMMMGPGRSAQFLVESTAAAAPGVYPIRLQTQSGISNILLFSVGAFPEATEQESLPYSPPNRNDSIETAEPVQSTPVTINGTLRGPERDVYRIYAKAGETRVFEVEARRCGSAVDPVLTIQNGAGKQLARSDDSFGAGLDPRLQFTFPREGYYYVEVNDARFSRQAQNFYRLTMGSYSFADGLFPLGGKRGETTAVTFFGGNLKAPVKSNIDLRGIEAQRRFTTASAPNTPVVPFVFAVSDYPELIEPSAPVSVPSVINGRLSEAGKIDRYKIQVQPGDRLLIEVQARELGTSRLEAILTAYDSSGKKIDSAGDKPLPEDVFAVQGTSRTSSDPFLDITAPQGAHEIALSIEDLAARGGPQYGYRIVVRKQPDEFELSVVSPYVNIPAGGTAIVVVDADRRGYNGPIELSVADLPKGIRFEGGMIPREYVDANNARTFNRRGMLILSADPGVTMPTRDLQVWGAGKLDDGTMVRRRARGSGMSVEVTGATAQGVVDRQRPVTAPWMGLDLPAASTLASPAKLEVTQVKLTRLTEGDRYDFAYKWEPRSQSARFPNLLNVDVVGARDIRVTSFEKSGMGGSFSISTTKATDPARYDIIIRGRVTADGVNEDVYARPLPLIVTERSPNVQVASH